jgi:hypothetical protein
MEKQLRNKITNYWKNHYTTNAKNLNMTEHNIMTDLTIEMMNEKLTSVNCELLYAKQYRNEPHMYEIAVEFDNPTFPNARYGVYMYNAEHDGLYHGVYDLENEKYAFDIVEQRIAKHE